MATTNPPDDHPKGLDDVRYALKGNLYIFTAIVLFGMNIPVVKFLIPAWLDADAVTVVRLMGGCLLFWIASLFVKAEKIQRQDFLKVFLGGGLCLFAFIYLLNLSLKYGNPIDIAIILTLPPVYVIIYEWIFKHMRPTWMEIVGMLAAFGGAVIVIFNSKESAHASNPLLGDLIAMANGVAYAAYLIILERPTHTYKPISLLRWVFLGASVPTLLVCCWGFDKLPIFHQQAQFMPWFWTFFLMAGPSFFAYLIMNPAIKLIGSELVSLYQYFMPVVTAIIAVIMGEAKFQWAEGIAMAVIIGGMILTNRGDRSKEKRQLRH